MIVTTAVMLLGAALPTQASGPFLVACNQAFAPTRPPLSTNLPSGGAFQRCIAISGWGDSARAVPAGPGGGTGQVVLDAFSVTVVGEGPEVMLFRQRLLQGQPLSDPLVLWQVNRAPLPGALANVVLADVMVQAVTTAVYSTNNFTTMRLQPRSAIWTAWSKTSPGPDAPGAITHTANFRDP